MGALRTRSRPLPKLVAAGSCALATSSVLYLANAAPLPFSGSDATSTPQMVLVASLFLAIAGAVAAVLLLAAFFALRQHRWPKWVAVVFALLMVTTAVGAVPLYVASGVAALVGSVLLWFPSARKFSARPNEEARP